MEGGAQSKGTRCNEDPRVDTLISCLSYRATQYYVRTMRIPLFPWQFIFFFLLLMDVSCHFCNKHFKNPRGLSIHLGSCKNKIDTFETQGKRYRELKEQNLGAKIRQIEGQVLSQDRQSLRERIHETDEVCSFVPFFCRVRFLLPNLMAICLQIPGLSGSHAISQANTSGSGSLYAEENQTTSASLPLPEAPGPALGPSLQSSDTTQRSRQPRAPKKFRDFVPSSTNALPEFLRERLIPLTPAISAPHDVSPTPCTPTPPPAEKEAEPPETIFSAPNEFGLFRVYNERPTYDPDDEIDALDVCDAPTLGSQSSPVSASSNSTGRSWWSSFSSSSQRLEQQATSTFVPFLNATVFHLMHWFYSSTTKSAADLQHLVDDVILAPDFDQRDLRKFSAKQELRRLDVSDATAQGSPQVPTQDTTAGPDFLAGDGWREGTVKISLPKEQQKFSREADAPTLEIPGIFYRKLTEVIRWAFSEAEHAPDFHISPFTMFWNPDAAGDDCEPPPNPPDPSDPKQPPSGERIYSETYNSDAMIEEHKRVCSEAQEAGCQLETVIASILLWSDATHLTNFGTASLWPIYVFFGNHTKYARSKPSAFAAHHLAYIPSVSPRF